MLIEESDSVLAIPLYDNGKGRFLMPLVIDISNPKAFYKLPGGVVEKYETFQDAVRRETWQETGLHIFGKMCPYIGKIDKSTFHNRHIQYCYALHVLNINTLHKKPVLDGNELLKVKMFYVEQVRRAISTATEKNDPKIFTPHTEFIRVGFKKLFGWE